MKVGDFVKTLLEQDQELEVVMASDSEGNSFHTSDIEYSISHFDKEESELMNWDDDEEDEEYIKHCSSFPKVLILWP